MSKPRKARGKVEKKIVLLPDEAKLIADAAEFLWELADKIPRDAPKLCAQREGAVLHSATLRSIVDAAKRSELLEINVAIGYAVRKELTPGNSKRARGETAEAHNVTDGTVSAFYTRQREVAHKSIERWVADYTDETIKRSDALRALLEFLVVKAERGTEGREKADIAAN